jgi:hypothetical protein
MKNINEIIKILNAHFDNTGWPEGLTHKKLLERTTISSIKTDSGSIIVEIERHRSLFGEKYIPGVPMSNFETYAMRYAIDPINAQVKELPEAHIDYELDFEAHIDDMLDDEKFDLQIEPVEEGKYKILETVSHDFTIAASLEDVNDFVLTFVDQFTDYFIESLESLEDDKLLDGVQPKYEAYLMKCLLDMAKKLWKKRHLDSTV